MFRKLTCVCHSRYCMKCRIRRRVNKYRLGVEFERAMLREEAELRKHLEIMAVYWEEIRRRTVLSSRIRRLRLEMMPTREISPEFLEVRTRVSNMDGVVRKGELEQC